MKKCKLFPKPLRSHRILRKLLVWYQNGRSLQGRMILLVPTNLCPSCEIALVRHIVTLNQRGYIVERVHMHNAKGECCQMLRSLRQSIWQELRKRRKQDFWLFLILGWLFPF